MSDNKFDNYLRDRLLDQVSPVPADMWQRIHPDKRRRKRIYWIWWLIGPAIILSGLYIGYRSSTSVATRPGQNKITSSTQNTPSTLSAQPNSVTAPTLPTQSTLSQPNHIAPSKPIISSTRFDQTIPSGQTHPSRHPNTYPYTPSPITVGVQHEPFSFDRRPPLPAGNTKPNRKEPVSHPSNWYLDAYVSPDWPLNRDGRLSYTAGFRLGRTFGPHFTGAIGIQYSDIRERNTPEDSLHLPYKLDLKTLDIPLLISYRTGIGNATAAITSGVIFNIHSWEKMEAPSPIGNVYKTNTGLSLYLGLNYTEPLNDKLSLFVEPYIRYRLSNMTDYPYLFPKKIHVAGLSWGVRYNFNFKSHIYDCP